jgi:2,3-bisphosphoglycerate-dependent phosphoglycerate mutase
MSTHTFTLLRHGQSAWNLENRFTGWTDVPLTATGEQEARDAGRVLQQAGLSFNALHTSLLRRAIHTAQRVLETMELDWIPVHRHWRLNERHYGALQGLNKGETAAAHGEEQVLIWRRSYAVPPPPLDADDPRHPAHDARYAGLAPDALPATECLADTVERLRPWWDDVLVPSLGRGERPLIVAHGNSLRALMKLLEHIGDEEVLHLNIPTGVPIVYTVDSRFRMVDRRWLGDEADIAARAAAVAHQGRKG